MGGACDLLLHIVSKVREHDLGHPLSVGPLGP